MHISIYRSWTLIPRSRRNHDPQRHVRRESTKTLSVLQKHQNQHWHTVNAVTEYWFMLDQHSLVWFILWAPWMFEPHVVAIHPVQWYVCPTLAPFLINVDFIAAITNNNRTGQQNCYNAKVHGVTIATTAEVSQCMRETAWFDMVSSSDSIRPVVFWKFHSSDEN